MPKEIEKYMIEKDRSRFEQNKPPKTVACPSFKMLVEKAQLEDPVRLLESILKSNDLDFKDIFDMSAIHELLAAMSDPSTKPLWNKKLRAIIRTSSNETDILLKYFSINLNKVGLAKAA